MANDLKGVDEIVDLLKVYNSRALMGNGANKSYGWMSGTERQRSFANCDAMAGIRATIFRNAAQTTTTICRVWTEITTAFYLFNFLTQCPSRVDTRW